MQNPPAAAPRPQFNAAALLDPKGAAKNSQTSNAGNKSLAGKITANSVDHSGSRSVSLARSDHTQSRDGAAGPMIERLYNVGKREHHLHKRLKKSHEPSSEEYDESEEDIREKSKGSFAAGGKGGEIAEYIQKKRQEGLEATTPPPAIFSALNVSSDEIKNVEDDDVVVTSSRAVKKEEDDDIVVIRDNSDNDREVCLGRIDNARVNVHMIPTPKSSGLQGIVKQWPPMKVNIQRRAGTNTHIISITDPTGKDFGSIDVRTASALAPMMDSVKTSKVRLQARLALRERKPYEFSGMLVSDSYAITINVYAPKKLVPGIGKFFSQKQVFFKHPLSCDRGVEIYNPHAPKDHTPKKNSLMASTSQYMSSGKTSIMMRSVEEVRSDVLGMFDSLNQSENLPEHNTPSKVLTELLPHQKQALHFMLSRERLNPNYVEQEDPLWKEYVRQNGVKVYYNVISGHELRERPTPVLGGILADAMGLGKTLNILSLIVSTMVEAGTWASNEPQPPSTETENELKCNSKGTLLICPLSTMGNWEDQIRTHLAPKALRCYVYHGGNRLRDMEKLCKYDLVITTYSIVSSEFDKRSLKKPNSPLRDINWFRIVLDEAHMIREQSTRQSKASCALSAQRRWAVTGTPVQNRLDDLGALIKFLRIQPFDERGGFAEFILTPFKLADPEILPKLRLLVDSITLRRLKDKLDLPKRTEQLVKLEFTDVERSLYDWFARDSHNKVKAMTNERKALGGKAYAHILRAILRLRLLCAHGQELLSDEDMELTKGFDITNAIDLEDEDDDRPAMNSKQAFEMLRIMREANVDFCPKCNNRIGPHDDDRSEDSSDEEEEENETLGFLTPCNHIICPNCIGDFKQEMENIKTADNHAFCNVCSTYIRLVFYELTQSQVAEAEAARAKMRTNPRLMRHMTRYSQPHTKVKALIDALKENGVWSADHADEMPIKSVVFSGWTSYLDLIQIALTEGNIEFTRLDGSMSRAARTQALELFATSTTCTCILVSMGAGGLGLNLTAASRVYVMEPQFNPAAEAQAVERVHRLGQTRDVEISRFIMANSFEEKILELQRKKQRLADLSMERNLKIDRAEAARKRLEELKSLFK